MFQGQPNGGFNWVPSSEAPFSQDLEDLALIHPAQRRTAAPTRVGSGAPFFSTVFLFSWTPSFETPGNRLLSRGTKR